MSPGTSSRASTTRLAHRRVLAEPRLDLARLDAEAADLHLLVDAAQELDPAVGEMARQVAGAVEPRRRHAERVGDEALRRQLRPPQVAARQAVAAERRARRRRRSAPAGRARPAGGPWCWRSAGRAARRLPAPPPLHRVAAGEGGVLGRPVAVDQPRARKLGEHPPHMRTATARRRPPGAAAPAGAAPGGARANWWNSPAVSQSVVTPSSARAAARALAATAACGAAISTSAAAVEQRRPDLAASRRRRRRARTGGRAVAGPEAGVVGRRSTRQRPRRGGDLRRPWAGRSSPRCRSRRPGCPARSRPAGSRPRASPRRRPSSSTVRRRSPAARAGASSATSTGSPAVGQHEGQPLRRVGRIERHVGAAGLEDRPAAPRPAPASARGRRRPAPPARRPARAGGGPAGWRARSSSP